MLKLDDLTYQTMSLESTQQMINSIHQNDNHKLIYQGRLKNEISRCKDFGHV